MEFRQIEAFINVVKYQSFSKAAKIMFLSQPQSVPMWFRWNRNYPAVCLTGRRNGWKSRQMGRDYMSMPGKCWS